MKKIILLTIICTTTFIYGQQKDYAIQALPFTQVMLADNFWLPRIRINNDGIYQVQRNMSFGTFIYLYCS